MIELHLQMQHLEITTEQRLLRVYRDILGASRVDRNFLNAVAIIGCIYLWNLLCKCYSLHVERRVLVQAFVLCQ